MIQKSKRLEFGKPKKKAMYGTTPTKKKKAMYGKTPKKMTAGGMGKPDYIDIDGDGNKTEPMKQAAKDKKNPKGMKAGYGMSPGKKVKMKAGKSPMKAKSGKSPMKDRRKKK